MRREIGGWLLCALALTGCYEHRTLEFTHEMPEPDGSVRRPDGAVPDGAVLRPEVGIGMCGGAATVSRLTSLGIPTIDDTSTPGALLGHDLDGVGESCGLPDYAGGVDNAFIDLAAALPSLALDQSLNLQTAIDAALRCTAGDASCALLALDLNVTQNAERGCAEVVFTDSTGAAVSTPGSGSVSSNGTLRVELATFDLVVPYPTPNGPVSIPLRLRDVIVTASLAGGTIHDIVIGGSLQKGEFEATVRSILPLISDEVQYEDVEAILRALYDVRLGGGCTGLSVGFVAQVGGGT